MKITMRRYGTMPEGVRYQHRPQGQRRPTWPLAIAFSLCMTCGAAAQGAAGAPTPAGLDPVAAMSLTAMIVTLIASGLWVSHYRRLWAVATRDLDEQRDLFGLLIESVTEGVGVYDQGLNLRFSNSRARELLGTLLPTAMGRMADNASRQYIRTLPDGTTLDVRDVPLPGGGLLSVFGNVANPELADGSMDERDRRYLRIIEALDLSREGILITDRDRNIIYANEAGMAARGLTKEDIRENRYWPDHLKRFNGAFNDRVVEEIIPAVEACGHWEGSVRLRDRDGTERVFAHKAAIGSMGDMISMDFDITERQAADRKAQRHSELMKAVLDTVPALISLRRYDGTYEFVNRQLAETYAVARDDIVGQTADQVLGEIDETTTLDLVRQVLDSGEEIKDLEFVPPRFRDRTFHVNIIPVALQGDAPAALTVCFDVTERRELELALERQAETHRTILDNLPASIAQRDASGRYVFANRSLCEQFNLSAEHWVGRTANELFGIPDGTIMEDLVNEVLQSGEPIRFREYENARFPGRTHLADVIPLKDADGNITGVVHSRTDITYRKEIEAALQEQMRLLHVILDNLPSRISLRDTEGRYVFANETLARQFGVPAQDFVGKSLNQLFGPCEGESLDDLVRQVLRSGAPVRSREFTPPRFPETTDLIDIIPLTNARGELTGLLTARTDITDRKNMDLQLQEQMRRLYEILDNLPAEISLRDAEGRFVFANESLARLHEIPASAFHGKTTAELVGPIDGATMNDFVQEVLKTGKAIKSREYEPARFKGRTNLADVIPLHNSDGEMTGLLTSRIDITDRKRMESALKEQTQRLHDILDNLPAEISLRDTEGRFVFANDALAGQFGISARTSLARPRRKCSGPPKEPR